MTVPSPRGVLRLGSILTAVVAFGFLAVGLMLVSPRGSTPLPLPGGPVAHETSLSLCRDLYTGTPTTVRCAVSAAKSLTESVPLPDAAVEVTLTDNKDRKEVVTGKTDPLGFAVLDLLVPRWPAGEYTLLVSTRSSAGQETITKTVTLKDGARVLLVSDKPLYQPGQTIHLRALCLDNMTLKPVANEDLTFEVEDARGNKVGKKTLKVSEHGIAAYSFDLASEVNQGDYQLRATLGETTATKTVAVKPYVLPKFKSAVTADKRYYLPKETLKGTLQVDYFFGKPVAGGDVEVTASTFDVAFKDFQTFKGKTDESGKVEFEIQLPDYFVGQPLDKGNALVKLEVKVTDTANHSETVTKTYPVANQPIRLSLIPEGGRLVPGVESRVFVAASYPDGSPVVAKIDVWKAPRPVNPFPDRDGRDKDFARDKDFPVKDRPGREAVPPPKERGPVLHSVKTNAAGLAEFRFTPGKDDVSAGYGPIRIEKAGGTVVESWGPLQQVGLIVEARDEKGNATALVRSLQGDPRNALLLRTDKAIYQGGERVRIDVRTTASFPTVYLDVVREGQTVLTKVLEVKDGQARHDLDLPAELSGSLEIHAYQIQPLGEIVRDARIVYVHPASDLKIDIQADKGTYKPGAGGKVNFQVADAAGKPTPAALGLIIVDEAVYALQEMQPGLEKVYFTLQKELLEPKVSNVIFQSDRLDDLIRERELPRERQLAAEVLLTTIRPPLPRRIDIDPARERRIAAEAAEQERRRREERERWRDKDRDKGGVVFRDKDFKDKGGPPTKDGPPLLGGPVDPNKKPGDGSAPVRVREYFPETMLWYPALITDEQGKVGSSRVDLQACKLEYSIVSPK